MISLIGLKSRASGYLKRWSTQIEPNGYYNLGADKLPAGSPRALVIYTTQYLHKVLYKQAVDEAMVNSHSGFWESLEMLRLLNEAGYIVDYFSTWNEGLTIEWDRYDLVIDERDNLRYCTSARPVKVFYCTGVYWLLQNAGELRRIEAFLTRTGIKTMAKRQAKPNTSDQYADLLTHFGADTQLRYFTPRHGFVSLNISVVTEPLGAPKNLATARRNFVWFGGAGFLHKGVDVAIEAFKQLPNTHLHILGGINEDAEMNEWLRATALAHPNIHLQGWMNTESPDFAALLNNAVGVLLPSASEAGPTSVPQAMHFGLLPIVTTTTNLRCSEGMAYVVDEINSDRIIAGLVAAVRQVQALPDAELLRQSDNCRAFAQENFTRRAYTRSFVHLLARVAEVRQARP